MRMGIWFFIAMLLPFGAAAEQAVQTGSVEIDAVPDMDVSVDNVSGTIHVQGSDTELVQASWTVNCGSEEELEALEVIVSTESGLSLSVDYSDDWDRCVDCSVDFVLTVPRGIAMNYSLDQVNGDLQLIEARGTAGLALVNGGVTLTDFQGGAYIDVVNGEISAAGSPGLHTVDMVNGALDLVLEQLEGDLSVETVNASVTLELLTEAQVMAETMSGDIVIDPKHEPEMEEGIASKSASFGDSEDVRVFISTLNGDIEIK
jgi:DUF4097 and DUF4098 domain-containing protein YvlB